MGDNIVYIFVVLSGMDVPEYHIVPGRIVAKTITREHQEWLDTPGRNGQKHNDNSIRKFSDAEQKRIVDRIESLFGKLDEAKEKAQAVVDGFEE